MGGRAQERRVPSGRARHPSMPMRGYLDGQAKDDSAAHYDDLFDPCRAILGSQKPFNAMQEFHVSTLPLGRERIVSVLQI
jgi:hypothetical protein